MVWLLNGFYLAVQEVQMSTWNKNNSVQLEPFKKPPRTFQTVVFESRRWSHPDFLLSWIECGGRLINHSRIFNRSKTNVIVFKRRWSITTWSCYYLCGRFEWFDASRRTVAIPENKWTEWKVGLRVLCSAITKFFVYFHVGLGLIVVYLVYRLRFVERLVPDGFYTESLNDFDKLLMIDNIINK